MAGSSVGKQVGRKLERVASELARAQRSAVTAAALAITTEIRQEIASATGDGRLSGVGKGARVSAGYDVKGNTNPSAVIKARGPLHLVERPTRAHEIRVKARRARRGRAALSLPDGGYRGRVRHPGSRRGRQPFARGLKRGLPAAERILRNAFSDAARRGFRA